MADNFNAKLYARGYASTVVSRTPSTPPPQPNPCLPACASCGLLECLCRPRFFAGQLLTEQDLNRLDGYIRAKNRMHNLQLHGWGVVNGLQVRCDACGAGVVVGTGYAIDPCGEDIVVCGDTPVDICSLIKRCQQADITCVPSSRTAGSTTCEDVEEDWVLSIRYTETQARAITALRSTPSCACGCKTGTCTCGGSSCGCGNKAMMSAAPTNAITASTAQRPRTTPAECEATAICEGYSFDVCLAPTPPPPQDVRALPGALVQAYDCCIAPLKSALPTPPGAFGSDYSQNAAAWVLWCCRMKEALIAFFSTGPQSNCTLVTRLQSYACPSVNDPSFLAKMTVAVDGMILLELEAMLACLCAALLPPAPCGTSDDRVPLAIVTVRKRDCRVLRVCNWTSLRKLVVTFPNLEYWLSWIPWLSSIQDTISGFCCSDLKLAPPPRTNLNDAKLEVAAVDSAPAAPTSGSPAADEANLLINPALDAQQTTANQTMTTLLVNAIARGNTPLDPKVLVSSLLGYTLPSGSQSPLTAAETSNVGPFFLLNQIARPIVASSVPDDLATRVAALEKAIASMSGKAS